MREINQLDNAEAFTQLPNSWEERGIRKGIEQGREQGIEQVVRNMLKEGASIEFIAKVTDMEKGAIEELKKQI